MEMALLDRLARVLARVGDPPPLVPKHHRPAAIFALGDGAFEVAVIERMVLGPHRKAVLARVEARTFRNGPALQHSVELEPEVPVQPRGVVLLDHEAVALALELAPLGLFGLREIALPVVGVDVERHALGHSYALLRSRALAGSFFAEVFFAGAFFALPPFLSSP